MVQIIDRLPLSGLLPLLTRLQKRRHVLFRDLVDAVERFPRLVGGQGFVHFGLELFAFGEEADE